MQDDRMDAARLLLETDRQNTKREIQISNSGEKIERWLNTRTGTQRGQEASNSGDPQNSTACSMEILDVTSSQESPTVLITMSLLWDWRMRRVLTEMLLRDFPFCYTELFLRKLSTLQGHSWQISALPSLSLITFEIPPLLDITSTG